MTTPFLLGLTGSIGMGKSTTAKMFAELGCDVWDADAAVHRLYARDGAAVEAVASLLPDAVSDGEVQRDALKSHIKENPEVLSKIEDIVHPLVAEDRARFIGQSNAEIVVLDIPLLFENGTESEFDAVAVVSVDPDTQRKRVIARGQMSEEMFEKIRAKQMPNAEKEARADFVIPTYNLRDAKKAVETIVMKIRAGEIHA
ncbi:MULTISPECIES: dephospho-CoA kinase [Halocynthiibacter]|uniref:Dephospho-CoA kinase n=1 Tax=Halocynthiibacter halioticoli TaxID=2986804 RepID=A0AAE3J387_9RHOB|nr:MULTISPECIES: dephospho-CoA kinase [Halocynthiibacter]MCV6825616.1 dephospho-CoA kinase [Halocynthiibacter halioticoli]MCW4058617.1 dephospho-CoA kinase [Halocynthiibacter sp. SDUM655004]